MHIILGRTTTGAVSDMTFGRAKGIVARTVGDETGPRTLAHAAECLRAAIGEWNRRHQFEWNAVRSYTTAVVAGDDTYDLPAGFLHMHSVRMTVNDRPLRYMRQRFYDRVRWDQDTPTFTSHYTLFGHGQDGSIKLIGIPTEDDVLEMRYYQGIVVPTADEDLFGLPERHVWGIIYKAKALLLLDRDAENTRMAHWIVEAEKAFRDAREDDVQRPDEDVRLIPAIEHNQRTFPESHPYHYLGVD